MPASNTRLSRDPSRQGGLRNLNRKATSVRSAKPSTPFFSSFASGGLEPPLYSEEVQETVGVEYHGVKPALSRQP